MSVRNIILDNLRDGLTAISGATTVARDYRAHPLPSKTMYPALYIVDDGGDEITNYCADDTAQATMLITVVGYYHAAADLSSGFSAFLDLIYDAIYAPISLGSNARDCVIISVNPVITDPDEHVVLFHVNVQIKYWRTLL